ncbi:MAG TPA: hypothetical protein VNJ50_00575 [Gelidibacter sp.]|uniref:hypothetical protein n=1 Tax=Gelidibacter sp. TaxID=2018083 RepID=UPI002D130A47|nr:hypothetical protein [Gelidibacter sp.]HXJ97313.1 hypothetical protein [Gelidibacter sp.]
MKTNILKICVSFIVIISMLTACHNDDESSSLYYVGKVTSLNRGDGCQNIIEITKKAEDGELGKGATISFNRELYGSTLKIGDNVYFKIIDYKDFGNVFTTNCVLPQYAALIEFYNK